MSERNYGAEIDALRQDITELKELLKGGKPVEDAPEEKPGNVRLVEKISDMTSDTVLASLMERIQDECMADGSTGRVVYTGVFASGGRQSNWIGQYNTDNLLKLIEDRTAEKVLNCMSTTTLTPLSPRILSRRTWKTTIKAFILLFRTTFRA